MIRRFIPVIAFVPVLAYAQAFPAGIPENCQAPLAHDMEMANIPYLLDLGQSAAHIKSIDTVVGVPAYEYYPDLYRIDCYITVHWSNGTVDYMHKFSMWEDKYGGLKGTYTAR